MSTDDDITPEPTATPDELEKFRKAYSAILDGKVETRLHRLRYDGVETAAIVMKRPVGKTKERVIPLFVAVSPAVLDHLSTMWGDPLRVARPEPTVPIEPAMVTHEDAVGEAEAEEDDEHPE